ncbi:acetyl-CoA carboxylase biotin carboxyl carrier protein [Kitasatospora sp. LaBMicrA B282]|uniref:acetyl-CoA carboxylase biotin carboxyl carrier protein n=1 Tax=Kitasatospora sp. LaBMicrA B282 TaxID=3420949 RepID=UPI003D09E6DC
MKPERAEWERREGERRMGDRRVDGVLDGAVDGRRAAVRPVAPAAAPLDEVCRNVADLAKAAPTPPRRIRMQDGQTTVEIEWPDPAPPPAATPPPDGAAPAAAPAAGESAPGAAEEPADTRRYVRAPMVGTFYHAGSPDAPPFVSIGDLVQPGQPVGVLEAMKMMSTITADTGGRVVEVLAPNAHPVEFDQCLIALEPVAVDGDRP